MDVAGGRAAGAGRLYITLVATAAALGAAAAAWRSHVAAADSNAAITMLLGGASQQLQQWRLGMDAALEGTLQAQEKTIAARVEAIIAGMREERRSEHAQQLDVTMSVWRNVDHAHALLVEQQGVEELSSRSYDPYSNETLLAIIHAHHNNTAAAAALHCSSSRARAQHGHCGRGGAP
jgi:hypothetical protein